MTIGYRKLHPLFGAEVTGLEIKNGTASPGDRDALIDAIHTYGIVLMRDQHPSELEMSDFARSLGPIWTLSSSMLSTFPNINEATSVVYQYSNRGKDGKPLPDDDPAMVPLKINEIWHTDSTYSRPGAAFSIFAGRTCPAVGGNTEFCDTRVAYEALDAKFRERLSPLIASHSIMHSLSRVGSGDHIKGEDRTRYASIKRPLVHKHVSGRTSLCLASHIFAMEGMSSEECENLRIELTNIATTPERVYSHQWRSGDVIIWDNRCTMHRATPYDSSNNLREMWIIRIADAAEMGAAAA